MNDAAARTLGMTAGSPSLTPSGGLAPDLRRRIESGIIRRGKMAVVDIDPAAAGANRAGAEA
jgi:hypothetical protein